MKKQAGRVVFLLFLAMATSTGGFASGGDEAADPWAPARFLVGSWSTEGLSRPEEGNGDASFSLELDNTIMVRKNRVEFPPVKPGDKPAVHEDLMLIYRGPGGFRAMYFDNEKHVIEYAVTFAEKESAAVFETLNSEGPRFRLLYRLLPDKTLAAEFFIAQPGKGFALYLKGRSRRQGSVRPDMK